VQPVLFANPRTDEDFVSFVNGCASRASSAIELQEVLRGRFPKATVRERLLDAEPVRVWYVYRDGRWVSGERGDEG
jgi:hypothetical protein